MKKLSTALLACVLLLALTACDDLPANGVNTDDSNPTSSNSSDPVSSANIITAEDGYAEGYMGDVMRTVFFDFSVDSAYTCDSLDTYTPADGYQLLVADITIKNTSTYSMPMVDYDFQVQWGDYENDDAYQFPISESIIDNQMPAEYEIPINESVSNTVVFEVPADTRDFSISFLEYFTNDEEGDVFFVYFTAEHQ